MQSFKKRAQGQPLFKFLGKKRKRSEDRSFNWLKHLSKRGFAWMMAGNIGVDNLEKVAKITKIVDVSGNLETNKSKDKKKIINFLNKVKEINDRN